MSPSPIDAFLVAACVPRTGAHAAGTIDLAESTLTAHPGLTEGSILAAAALGDAPALARLLAGDRAGAVRPAGPYGWDPLTTLCFSNYLKLDRDRSDGFVRSATLLLEAGADANTGFAEPGHAPEPTFESVLYGACGVAHHEPLTRLLLAHGADPNDEEVVYHSPESRDNAALEALVETGQLTDESLTMMLHRKCDAHDEAGVRYLLAAGADPARASRWSRNALLHALTRDNATELIDLLIDHGADPRIADTHGSAIESAARRGRGDVLASIRSRGIPLDLRGTDALVAACALGDPDDAARLSIADPRALAELRAHAGTLLANFAGIGNTGGIAQLLDLGVAVDQRLDQRRGYLTIAARSTALHVAAWRARHETVALLLERGADPNARDADGATSLTFAVRACVDSYWSDRRRPDSVARLLAAGASVSGVPFPSGYDAVDALLSQHGAR